MSNLTYEQRLLTNLAGVNSLSGSWVVLFERLKGGTRFVRLINPGESFRKLNWAFWRTHDYFAIAVNQSILRYAFNERVLLDDGLHRFTLIIHLTFRAIDPKRVAESADQDPLRRLCHEIARTLGRSCAKRDWEMIKRRFRELELVALMSEQPMLQQTAATLGLEIVNIELDSQLPPEYIGADRHIIETDTKLEMMVYKHQATELDHDDHWRRRTLEKEIEIREDEYRMHRSEHMQLLLMRLEKAIDTTLMSVGKRINTPDELIDALEVLRETGTVIPSKRETRLLTGIVPTTSKLLGEGGENAQRKLTSGEKRWINVELEGDTPKLLLDHVYTLVFDVDMNVRVASLARDVEFRYDFKADETAVELEVHLSSQDFRIYDDRQKLYIPRTGKSENKARFDIKSLHDGPGKLKALILKDNNFIQELTLTIDAGNIQVIVKGRPPEAATIVNPRDVHLNIRHDNGSFELKFISGVTASTRIQHSPQEIEDLAQEVRQVWNKIVAKQSNNSLVYQTGVDIPESVRKDSLKRLAKAGAGLFKKVFFENQDKQAQAIGRLLRNMARDEPLKIQITSEKFFLPWGVLYVGSDVDTPDPSLFLGLKHIIEHIPTQNNIKDFRLQIDGNPKFSVSLNLDKRIDTEAAAKGLKPVVAVQEEFWDRLKRTGFVEPRVRSESSELLEVVRKHAMDERLIYFYCHASARMKNSETHIKPSITLGDGKKLTIDDLSNKEGTELMSLSSAPLLFLNACDSADFSPFFYDDFLHFFVSRGARGAIGTECRIPAVFAAEWANRFFARFLPGKSLGALFLELRREFYNKHHNLLGLAYALYCDADTKILPGLTINNPGKNY